MSKTTNITHDAITLYIKGLEAKGYSKQEIAAKLRNVGVFMEWAYEKDHIAYPNYQHFKDEIAKYSKMYADNQDFSIQEDQQEAISSDWATPQENRGPPTKFNEYNLPILGDFSEWPRPVVRKPSRIVRSLTFIKDVPPLWYGLVVFTILVISILGAGIYTYYFNTDLHLSSNSSQASVLSATTPTFPSTRILNFQGRLTDSLGNPITTSTNMRFRLYDASTVGTTLYDSGTCAIAPDQDGIHNVLIGSDCGSGIAESVFTENTEVWLGVTVGTDSEMTPRQQIANVPYALNAETLQGLPPGTSASNVAYINAGGDMLIAAAGPQIGSTYTSETFLVSSANAITIQSAGSGDVTLNASESGEIIFTAGGAQAGVIENGGQWGVGIAAANALLDVGGGTATSIDGTNDLLVADDVEIDGDLYVEGTIDTTFTQGSLVFAGASGALAEDNANLFWDDTANKLGIGKTPVGKLDVSGAVVGKALAIFDETGDQNIITASAGAITRMNLTTGGQLELLTDGSSAGITIGADEDFSLYFDGTNTQIANTGGDFVFTSTDDIIFTDNQVTNIQLSDIDTTLPNSNTGIVDAINDAWNAAIGGGGGLWTDSGTTTYLTTTTDDLVLGGTSPLSSAKLSIDGDADQIQLIVQGNGTQTSDLFVVESSAGTNYVEIDGTGQVGIGVNPTTLLDIEGSTSGNTPLLKLNNTNNSGAAVLYIDTQGIGSGTNILDVKSGGASRFVLTGGGEATFTSDASTRALRATSAQSTTTFTSTFAQLEVANTNTTNNNYARINFSDGDTQATAAMASQITDHTSNFGTYEFWTRGSDGLVQRMSISETGAVSINGFTASNIGLTITGAASQSGNLTTWEANGGTDLSWIDESGNVRIGSSAPDTGKLNVNGADTGKALAIFNETGDQNIITASAGGVTVANLTNAGNFELRTQGDLILYDSDNSNYSGFQAHATTTGNSVYTLPANYPGSTGFMTSDTSGNLSWDTSTYDNYNYWTFAVDGVSQDNVTTADILDFVSGSDIDVTRSADDTLTFALESTLDIVSTINLAGTGTLNGLDAVDATTEDTIEALIFDADAENISGVWEVQDNVGFVFGNDANFTFTYDETTDDRLEITATSPGSDVYWDLVDAVADSTFTITNSNGTFAANLSVEGNLTGVGGTFGNVQVGITGDNEIDTSSGNLTLDSAGGTTTIDDAFVVSGTSDLQSTIANSTGNISIVDNVDLTGNFDASGTIQAGSSNITLTLATGYIDADSLTLFAGGDGVGVSSSATGLEVQSDGLTLLQGCTDNYILKWDEATDTWNCEEDATGGGSAAWSAITDPTGNLALAMAEYTTDFSWNTAATAAGFDGLTLDITNDATTDATTQRLLVLTNADDAGATGTTENLLVLDNADANEAVTTALSITDTGGGGFTTDISLQNGETIDNATDGTIAIGADVDISSQLAVGDNASITADYIASFTDTSIDTTAASRGIDIYQTRTGSGTGVTQYGIYNRLYDSSTSTNNYGMYGIYNELNSTNTSAGANTAVRGQTNTIYYSAPANAVYTYEAYPRFSGTGTTGALLVAGYYSRSQNVSTGTISNFANFYALSPVNTSGTMTTAYGLYVEDQSVGTNSNAYGLYVANQTGGSGTLAGIYIADADDYSLQLASTDGDAASGITFGTDTNLYRSAANTLHTDDSFDIDGNLITDGNTTLGNASGDTVTSNADAWTFANDTAVTLSGGVNGLNFDSNTLSIDATNDRVGIGTAAPDGKLQVTGASIGKALAIFNETGDQDIITASAGGTTRFRVATDGYIWGGRFVDISNPAGTYYVDPAATGGTAISIAGGGVFGSAGSETYVFGAASASTLVDIGGGTADFISGGDDLLVADDVEIDGDLYVAGGIDTAFTAGSVVFAGTNGLLTEDNAAFFWDDGANELGLGTNAPAAALDVLDTTEQLRLSYDASNTTSFTVSSGGDLTLAPSGGDTNITGNLDVSTWSAFGPNASATTSTLLNLAYTSMDTTSFSGYGINNTITDTSAGGSGINGLYQTITNSMTGASAVSVRGEYTAIANNSTTLNANSTYYGDYKKISNNVAATLNQINGYTTELENNSTGYLAGSTKSYESIIENNSTGTMNNVYHFVANSPANASGTINSIYGLIVGDQAVGTTTNAYGVYIGAQDGATNDYGLWADEGDWILDADGGGALATDAGGDLFLGEDQDLELYHDGTNSYIMNNTGDLYIGDAATDDVILSANGGFVGIGDTSPSATLEIQDTTEQLRLSYDASNTTSFTVSSSGDLTVAPSGGDTNVTGTLDVSSTVAIGSGASINSLRVVHIDSSATLGSGDSYGILNDRDVSGSTGTDTHYGFFSSLQDTTTATGNYNLYAASNDLILQNNSAGSNGVRIGTQGRIYNISTGTLSNIYNMLGSGDNVSTGTISNLYNFSSEIENQSTGTINTLYNFFAKSPTNASGTITTSYGLYVQDQSVGTNTNGYGIVIANQTGGSGTNAGLYITDADDYSIQLASTDGDAASGITFGTDTNLYRNAASSLYTDDAFTAVGNITTSGDLAVNGDDITSDGNLTLSATGYTRIGDTATPGSATADDDLFVEGALEVDGVFYLDGTLDTTFTAGSVVFAGTSGVLAEDNASFFWDDTSNELGIGTTSPAATLDVLDTTEQLRLSYDASNTTSFTVSSAGDLTLAPSGGDTSITGTLDVTSTLTAATGDAFYVNSEGHIEVGTPNGIFVDGNWDALIGSGSNAGIKLVNTDTSSATEGAGFILYSYDGAAMASGDRLGFNLFGGGTGSGTTAHGGGIVAYADGTWTGTSAPTRLEFEVAPSGSTSRTTAMVIKANGDIGIGTSGPDAQLDSLSTAGEQLRLTYADGTAYTGFTTSSGGDLTIDPSGGDIIVDGNVLPNTDDTYDLGSNTARWQDLYLGPQTLHIGTSTTDEGTIGYTTSTNTLTFTNNYGDTDFTTSSDGFNFTLGGGAGDDFIVDSTTLVVESDTDRVGIGTAAPAATLDVLDTTEQLRLSYDASNTTSFTVDIAGDLTVAPSGGTSNITGDFTVSGHSSFGNGAGAYIEDSKVVKIVEDFTTAQDNWGLYIQPTFTYTGSHELYGSYNYSTADGQTSGYLYGSRTSANTANTTSLDQIIANYNDVSLSSGSTVTNTYGVKNEVNITSTAGATGAYGTHNTVYHNGAGTLSAAYGTYNTITNISGTITNGYGLYSACNDATTCYGASLVATDITPTTNYGLRVEASGAGTDNYGIFGANGDWILSADGSGVAGGTGAGGDFMLGASQDLELYHDGTNSYIMNNTGDLYIGDAATDDVIISANGGFVGIGDTTPSATLEIQDTTEQLRLSYDASNYLSTTISSGGDVTLNATGADIITDDRVTVGTSTAGVGQFNVSGAQTGKALTILNETGNQNILVASASGTGQFSIGNNGDISKLNGHGVNALGDQGGMVPNGGFEVDNDANSIPDGWTATAGTVSTTTTKQQGGYALEVSTSGTAISSCIPVTAGNSYTISGWGAGTGRATINEYTTRANCEANSGSNNNLFNCVSAGSSTYTNTGCTVNRTVANTSYWARILILETGGGASVYRFDALRMVPNGNTVGLDLAETYPIAPNDIIEPGHIVQLGHGSSVQDVPYISKTDSTYDNDAFGVVATAPGFVLDDGNSSYNKAQVALAGRVPVQVTSENGPIKVGDAITASSIPGVGMRSTKAARVVGRAMTEWTNTDPNEIGVVTVFVEPAFDAGYLVTQVEQLMQQAPKTLADGSRVMGTIFIQSLESISIKTEQLFAQTIQATNATIDSLIVDKIVGSSAELTTAEIETLNAQALQAEKARINELETDKTTTQELLAENIASTNVTAENATISGTLVADNVDAQNVRELRDRLEKVATSQTNVEVNAEKLDQDIQQVQQYISELTKSPTPEDITDESIYQSYVPSTTLEPATQDSITGDTNTSLNLQSLIVTGEASMTTLTVADAFSAGNVFIQDDQIVSLTAELKLNALEQVNIMNGGVIITQDGTITAKGEVIAQKGIRTNDLQALTNGDDINVKLGTRDTGLELADAEFNIQDKNGISVAGINASGTARFQGIDLDTYTEATSSAVVIASKDNYDEYGIYAPAIKTNAAASGNGILPQGENDIIIYNSTIREGSIVTVTPTSSTQNRSLYVNKVEDCSRATDKPCTPYFRVAIDDRMDKDVTFNWLIVQ